ncbi:hypothetical protein GCM10011410_23650 [Hoyosella rhizosphaerae]|uniref:DoxX family protein n=2 Tax=Hoyosella rhizosphaerae TaxID=1755582 RepID=A0A916UF07_9ACTN|nr:hypothetical protein GCM10011410_23650 [Hoyosella rhizosphaerae]
MLAGVFVATGISTLRNPNEVADRAAPFIEYAHGSLPAEATRNLPQDPVTITRINAAVQIGAGALLASGRAPRLASGVLAGSLIPSTIVQHPFWAETDAAARAQQRAHFLKNVGLLGGLLIAAADTEGKPSLGWRARRAASRASDTVSAALPFAGAAAAASGATTKDKLADSWSTVAERTKEAADEAADVSSDWFDAAAKRTSKWYETAANRTHDLYETASERFPEIYETAADRTADLYHTAAKQGSKVAHTAANRSSEVAARTADLAKENAAELRARVKNR